MKKAINISLILISMFGFCQKTEKIKASKNVTITQKELIDFKELELTLISSLKFLFSIDELVKIILK